MIGETSIYDINNEQNIKITKFILIENSYDCSKIVEEILMKQKIIALDCEGIYLSKEGKLTLIQVKRSLLLIFITLYYLI